MALTDKTTTKNIMTQYPLWKHFLLAFVLIIATLYTLPNFYPDEPAIQISSVVAGGSVPSDVVEQVEQALAEAGIAAKPAEYQERAALIAALVAAGLITVGSGGTLAPAGAALLGGAGLTALNQ